MECIKYDSCNVPYEKLRVFSNECAYVCAESEKESSSLSIIHIGDAENFTRKQTLSGNV